MRGLVARLRGDRRGTTAVEFALISTFLLSFAYGTIEFMGALQAWSGLQWACDLTARYAMANPTLTNANFLTYAQTQGTLAGYGAAQGVTYTVTSSTSVTASPTPLVTITGSYTYRLHVGLFGFNTIPLSASATAPLI